MEYKFLYDLTGRIEHEIDQLFSEVPSSFCFQHPDWTGIFLPDHPACHFLAYDGEMLVGYAHIVEHHKTAQLQFGPVVKDMAVVAGCIVAIREYYYEKQYGFFMIQPAVYDGPDVTRMQQDIAQQCKVTVKRANKDLWFSLRINLDRSMEDIQLDVSESTLRSIRRTERHKIYAQPLTSLDEALQLGKIYEFMYQRRKSTMPFRHPKQVFSKAFKFLHENGKGMIVGSFGRSGNLHGGIVVQFHGDTAYYRLGASKAYGKMPVLHPAFMEAIRISREKGYKFFDLGWYNPYIRENSSLGRISRFKKGFGGEIVAWAPAMTFRLHLIRIVMIKARNLMHSIFRN